MKTMMAARLEQKARLAPQTLQSIRLLQLNGIELEMEVRRMLASNPLLERIGEPEGDDQHATPQDDGFGEPAQMLPWHLGGQHCSGDADGRASRLPAGESSDPHVRVLRRLVLEVADDALPILAFWLEHTNDAGYLCQDHTALLKLAQARFGIDTARAEALRQRLLHGDPAGLAARDPGECLAAQLDELPDSVAGRELARRILLTAMPLLAAHDHRGLSHSLSATRTEVAVAVRLIRSLQPRPGEALLSIAAQSVIPDACTRFVDGRWQVALNPMTTPRLAVNPMYELVLSRDEGGSAGMRALLEEARWFSRSLSTRHDTLLRAVGAIVESQAGFLTHGDEAMLPLTLKDVAERLGMHESTISRITTGKYLQTPRGTFELGHFFATRLEGAEVSGPAVRAIVMRLIQSEPRLQPLADEAIARLLSWQGIHIARRTVAKYREQLQIAPARERRRVPLSLLAQAG